MIHADHPPSRTGSYGDDSPKRCACSRARELGQGDMPESPLLRRGLCASPKQTPEQTVRTSFERAGGGPGTRSWAITFWRRSCRPVRRHGCRIADIPSEYRAVRQLREKLVNPREQCGVGDEIASAVGVIFIEGVALEPRLDRRDIHLGDLWADAPGDLERRTLFVVARPGRRTLVLHGRACRGRDVYRLMHAIDDLVFRQLDKIMSVFVTHENEDLSLDAQLWIADGLAEARTERWPWCDLRGCVDVMNLDGVTGNQATMTLVANRCIERCKLRLGQVSRVSETGAEALAVAIANISVELTALVLCALVEMNVAEVHLGEAGRLGKGARVLAHQGIDVTRRLRPEPGALGAFSQSSTLLRDCLIGNVRCSVRR